jgi:hypothetical protein
MRTICVLSYGNRVDHVARREVHIDTVGAKDVFVQLS